MFLKNSRYANLKAVKTIDHNGEVVESAELRIIAVRPGEFVHEVQQPDRLDLLAHKYYQDSGKWWLIPDANPQRQLPTDLIDRFPIAVYFFSIDTSVLTSEDPWLPLQEELQEIPGVEKFAIDRDSGELAVELNQAVVTPEKVADVIEAHGFVLVGPPVQIPENGKGIVIPPNQSTSGNQEP